MDRYPLGRGFDAMFRGLGTLFQMAADTRPAGRDDASTFFGVSMRVGRRPIRVVPPDRPGRPAARRTPARDEPREPLADVFDEDDHILVVVQLPGVEPAAVTWTVRDETVLAIRAEDRGRAYARDIGLAARVEPATARARHENGILELRLWKRR